MAKPPSFGFEGSDNDIINSGGAVDVLLDVFRNLIPNNIIGATMWQDKTQITMENQTSFDLTRNETVTKLNKVIGVIVL